MLKTFEASDVARRDTRVRQNGKAHAAGRGGSYETFVVFDNARAIARMSSLLGGADPIKPVLLEYPGDDGSPSQFEGLAYNSHLDTFYVVRESAEHDDGVLVAHVYDVKLPAGDEPSQVVQIVAGPCDTEQEFSSANKGARAAARPPPCLRAPRARPSVTPAWARPRSRLGRSDALDGARVRETAASQPATRSWGTHHGARRPPACARSRPSVLLHG